jgi:hypothetical protein
VPSILFSWILIPDDKVKSIKLTIFIVSANSSIVYFIFNKNKFKGPADIVSFFTGASLGPVAVTELLL